MTLYQDQELFLMTSVVYREKFEVVGERMQRVCILSPPSLRMTSVYAFISIFLSPDCYQLKRVSGESAKKQMFIFFDFQREVEADLQTEPPILEGLISKLQV